MSQQVHKVVGRPVQPLQPLTEPCTKIGGQPVGLPDDSWPRCKQCGSAMSFLLQLDLQSPLKLASKYTYAFLFTCSGYEDDRHCDTYYGDYGSNAIVLTEKASGAPHRTPEGAVERPERAIEWGLYEPPDEDDEFYEQGGLDIDAVNRLIAARAMAGDGEEIVIEVDPQDDRSETLLLGGDPDWLQDDDTPQCPVCDGPTALLAQVDAEVEKRKESGEKGYYLPFGASGVGYLFGCLAECSPQGTYFLWQTT